MKKRRRFLHQSLWLNQYLHQDLEFADHHLLHRVEAIQYHHYLQAGNRVYLMNQYTYIQSQQSLLVLQELWVHTQL